MQTNAEISNPEKVTITENGEQIVESRLITEVEETEKPLLPIFIGCNNPEVIKLIAEYTTKNMVLSVDNADYEVVIMNEEILRGSTANWMLKKMSIKNQQDVEAMQKDKESYNTALKTAFDLDRTMRTYLNIPQRDSEEFRETIHRNYQFRHYALKDAIKMVKNRDMSNKQIREVIDFLTIHNILQPSDISATNYEKQKWEFCFDDVALLTNTCWLEEQIKYKLLTLQGQLDMLSINRKVIEDRLNADINDNTAQPQSVIGTESIEAEKSKSDS